MTTFTLACGVTGLDVELCWCGRCLAAGELELLAYEAPGAADDDRTGGELAAADGGRRHTRH